MGDKSIMDFYGVLGLKKECTQAQLRNAYKRLAMEWHPDRFSAGGNSKHVEEAKRRFQGIQQAYSVLSDAKKRFLYDVGVYDSNDDNDEHGMGDFLSEMQAAMTMSSQTKSKGNRNQTFEELQDLFNDMFSNDIIVMAASSSSHPPSDDTN